MAKEMFLASCSKGGEDYTITIKTACGEEFARERLERDGYVVESIVSAESHHVCKYCGGIAEGAYEDLLCADCRELFGHSLYSEL